MQGSLWYRDHFDLNHKVGKAHQGCEESTRGVRERNEDREGAVRLTGQ